MLRFQINIWHLKADILAVSLFKKKKNKVLAGSISGKAVHILANNLRQLCYHVILICAKFQKVLIDHWVLFGSRPFQKKKFCNWLISVICPRDLCYNHVI